MFSRAVRRAALAAPRDRVGARGVEADRVALAHRARSARSPPVRSILGVARTRTVGRAGRERQQRWPSSTQSPIATARACTTPSASASTSCSIFIASSTTTARVRDDRLGAAMWDRDDDARERGEDRVGGAIAAVHGRIIAEAPARARRTGHALATSA